MSLRRKALLRMKEKGKTLVKRKNKSKNGLRKSSKIRLKLPLIFFLNRRWQGKNAMEFHRREV